MENPRTHSLNINPSSKLSTWKLWSSETRPTSEGSVTSIYGGQCGGVDCELVTHNSWRRGEANLSSRSPGIASSTVADVTSRCRLALHAQTNMARKMWTTGTAAKKKCVARDGVALLKIERGNVDERESGSNKSECWRFGTLTATSCETVSLVLKEGQEAQSLPMQGCVSCVSGLVLGHVNADPSTYPLPCWLKLPGWAHWSFRKAQTQLTVDSRHGNQFESEALMTLGMCSEGSFRLANRDGLRLSVANSLHQCRRRTHALPCHRGCIRILAATLNVRVSFSFKYRWRLGSVGSQVASLVLHICKSQRPWW